jgi:hypothetical protein
VTAGRNRVDPERASKPAGGKIPPDSRAVEIAVRHARHEARRIVWEAEGNALVTAIPFTSILSQRVEEEYAARKYIGSFPPVRGDANLVEPAGGGQSEIPRSISRFS